MSRSSQGADMIYNKTCDCGATFQAAGPAGKYCKDCQAIRVVAVRLKRKLHAERKRRERGCKVGQGAPAGAAHPNYKHGYYVAQTQSRKYREEVQYCERCKVDTFELSRWHWVMHHKDHNHCNHAVDNLELLCKRCHAVEHQVHSHFDKEGATTISKESTP